MTPNRPVWVVAALALFIVAGLWLRVRHLGALGLVADEGNQILAVRGILEHGVPRVDSGRLYTRGLPFLYLEAAAAKLFGLNEFSLRLPSALFGVGSIAAAFGLAGLLFGWPVGLSTAALMSFSSWEIELSRYGRFYTAFQCCYLLALLCYVRGFLRQERPWKAWFPAVALLAFSMHEMGVLLAACFFIPLFSGRATGREAVRAALSALGLIGLFALYRAALAPLRMVVDAVPVGRGSASAIGAVKDSLISRAFLLPDTSLLRNTAAGHPWWVAALAGVAAAATIALLLRALHRQEGWRVTLPVLMVWAAFGHQIGLVLTFWILHAGLFARTGRDLVTPTLTVAYGAAAACLVFWGMMPVAGPDIGALLGYPGIYRYFLSWFIKGWPVMTVVFGLGCVWFAIRSKFEVPPQSSRVVLAALALPLLAASVIHNDFYEARYVFHLYPFMLIVVAATACAAGGRLLERLPVGRARGLVAAALGAAMLVVSQDADPRAAWAIGGRTYRSAKDPIRGSLNWKWYAGFHQDYKTPSGYVRERRAPGDRVIALTPPHKVAIFHYYVGRVDYSVEERPKDYQFRLKDGRIIDHVTASTVLEDVDELRRVCEGGGEGGVWLLGDRPLIAEHNHFYSEPMKAHLRQLAARADYVGLDGQTFAVKVR